MRTRELVRRGFVVFLCVAVGVTGCATTAELQEKYADFGDCFREQKVGYMVAAGLMTATAAALLTRRSRSTAVKTTAVVGGAAVGAIIGNKLAWQACLRSFPVQTETSVLSDRASTIAHSGTSAAESIGKSLVIQNVSAGKLMLGQDINATVTYRYISNDPAARDVKAQVSRHIIFKQADGTRHEIPSSTEDTIQQGVSRTSFAIPTPSVNDAKELASSTDWALKFVVQVDGMRQERIIPLDGSQSQATDTTAQGRRQATPAPSTAPSKSAPPQLLEMLGLRAGTRLFREANSPAPEIVAILPMTPALQTVSVLQRIVQGGFNWVQVRLTDGKEGWFRGDKQ